MYNIRQEISPKLMREKQDVLKFYILKRFKTISDLTLDVEHNEIIYPQDSGVKPAKLMKFVNKLN